MPHQARPKVIVISGTPGTGKSTLAKKLSLSKYWKLIEINKYVKRYDLDDGYDKARGSLIVNPERLSKALVKTINKDSASKVIIIEGHLAHFLPKDMVDLCVITTANLSSLANRLAGRGYPDHKVRENVDSEIFEVCLSEARDLGHNILILDTSNISVGESKKKILAKFTAISKIKKSE